MTSDLIWGATEIARGIHFSLNAKSLAVGKRIFPNQTNPALLKLTHNSK